MSLMKDLLGISVGGAVGLIVLSALLPTADTQINSANLTNSSADNLYDLLPLFIVIAVVGSIIGYAVVQYM